MRKYELFTLISLALIITIPILFFFFYSPAEPTVKEADPETEENDQEQEKESNNGNTNKEKKDKKKGDSGKEEKNADKEEKSDELHWGVDSASYTDEAFLGCVVDNFGKPTVWGRYLGDKEDVSFGLDEAEVKLLHDNDIKILLIYNHVVDARGYDNGVNHAEEAISLAESLGVPEGVAIFVDIEPDYPVDAAFIEGWYTRMKDSNYEPGVYGVFSEENEIFHAYTYMEQEIQENTIVWTAYPQAEISTKDNAPKFNPVGPEHALVYGWQYAIDSETCNIDTNLFSGNLIEYLW